MTSNPPLLVRARALTGFVDLVRDLDGNADDLLSAVGMNAGLLVQAESAISMPAAVALLENAAQALRAPDFGLLLAQRQDFSVLGPIALVASRADTVANALTSMARNLPYHVARTSLRLEHGSNEDEVCLRYELPAEAGEMQRQTVEMCCLFAVQALRMLSGESGTDWQVTLAHKPGMSALRYRKFFGCPVSCLQTGHGVRFAKSVLNLPINGENPQIRASAERYVTHLIRRNPLDLACQIEELVARQLANGDCCLPQVARQLGMHARTLQRRLDGQKVQFADILDRVRQRQAREYLRQPALSLSEVANLLGYSEQRSLSRACHRWFGKTPAAVRSGR